MHDIICPHCRKGFKVDEAGYADLLKQVRDKDFEKQLHERLELADKDKANELAVAREKATSEIQKATAAKDTEIQELKARIDNNDICLLYTSPSPRDQRGSRMPSSA